MGFLSKFKLCGKAKVLDPVGDAKDLYCHQGKSAVEADPEKAKKTLKSATKFLKKSGSPKARSLSELDDKPVEKFDDIKSLLEKIPNV